MVNDGSEEARKNWEELVTAASMETDPEKVAAIAEEIFAALEQRERALAQAGTDDPLPQQ